MARGNRRQRRLWRLRSTHASQHRSVPSAQVPLIREEPSRRIHYGGNGRCPFDEILLQEVREEVQLKQLPSSSIRLVFLHDQRKRKRASHDDRMKLTMFPHFLPPSGFETFKREYRTIEEVDQTEKFPHKCPECDGKAFVGLNHIECTNRGCRHCFRRF